VRLPWQHSKPAGGRPKEPLPAAWGLAAAFLVAFIVVPLVVVIFARGIDPNDFVCTVQVKERLGESLGGKLEFLLVDTVDGRSPADQFVATLDHGYTEGIVSPHSDDGAPQGTPTSAEIPETPVGSVFSLNGALMTPDVFYGDQHLFFGRPQVYASQVKTTLLWPSQIHRLEELYLSPFGTVASVYWVWMLPFAEEYSVSSWLLVIARFVLLCASVAAALVWRRKRQAWTPGVIWVAGVYVLLSIALAIPSL
jgi:hypothetical protein